MASIRDFVAALNQGKPDTALTIVRDLLVSAAPLGTQWGAVARFCAATAEWSLALDAARRFCAAAPGLESGLFLADLLVRAGRFDAAREWVERIAAEHPASAEVWHFLGTLLSQLGEAEAALACFDRVLAMPDATATSWLSWVHAGGCRGRPEAVARLVRAVNAARRDHRSDFATLLYALAKAREDDGDGDAAESLYVEAAARMRETRSYSADDDGRFARALIQRFPRRSDTIETAPSRSIFVTGLPRSGTTLVEQILASHSTVAGGGELNLLGIASRAMGGPIPRPHSGPAAASAFGALYHHLLAERYGAAGRVIDKSLNTSRFTGIVATALPQAPILWLERDVLDVAWSCFKTPFSVEMGWSFSLEDMGIHFALEDMLRAHWLQLYPDRILSVSYAALVQDPASWIPRIASHCGMTFEPQMAQSHTVKRAVTTSSVRQVREPIYTRALGSSAPHRAVLDPFLRSYQAARRSLGLGDAAL